MLRRNTGELLNHDNGAQARMMLHMDAQDFHAVPRAPPARRVPAVENRQDFILRMLINPQAVRFDDEEQKSESSEDDGDISASEFEEGPVNKSRGA